MRISRSLRDPFERCFDAGLGIRDQHMHVVVQGEYSDEEICRDKQCLSWKVYAPAPGLSFTPQFILGAPGTSEPKGASLGTASLIVGRFSSLFPARFVLKHARVLYANDLPHHPAQKVPVWAMARDKLQKPMFLMAFDFS